MNRHHSATWLGCVCALLLLTSPPIYALRELSTDRPDQNESPYSVDAGHFQIEADFMTAAWDRDENGTTHTSTLGGFNVKWGLTDNMDIQFISSIVQKTADQDTYFDNLTARLKINLWGNDSGSTAFGLLPFINLQSLQKGTFEGGIAFPYALALAPKWDLGLMAQVDHVALGDNRSDTTYFFTATVGHELTDSLSVYSEVATRFIPKSSTQVQLDFGATYSPVENLQLDCGTNIGITPSAPDLFVFTGISWKY